MCKKMHKRKIRSIFAGILALSLILSYPSSLNADLYLEKNTAQSLRGTAFVNGIGEPSEIFQETPPVDHKFISPKKGAKDQLIVGEGIVAHIKNDGTVTLVGPKTKLDLSVSRVPLRLTKGEVTAIKKNNPEYFGTDIDTASGQFRLLHMMAQKIIKNFPDKEELDRDGYIKLDVEFLPDFPLDENKEKLVEAILDMLAFRLLQYKKLFHDKIHIDFVSTAGNKKKIEKVKGIFLGLRSVKDYNLDEMLGAAPKGTDSSDIFLITHKDADIKNLESIENLKYTVLFLKKTVMIDEDTMAAYAWHSIMDLAVSTLIIKDLVVDEQKELFVSIKNLFEYLLGHEIEDELLMRFLGKDADGAAKAALDLALPPIEELNLEKVIGDIIRIMAEVAKYA